MKFTHAVKLFIILTVSVAVVMSFSHTASANTVVTYSYPSDLHGLEESVAEEFTHGFDRAATYWRKAPTCSTIELVYDDVKVGQRGAYATTPGCTVWFGDYLLAMTPVDRCAVLVHEYGHLLGMAHEHHADDPEAVMYYDDVTPMPTASVCHQEPTASAATMLRETWEAHLAATAPRQEVTVPMAVVTPTPVVVKVPDLTLRALRAHARVVLREEGQRRASLVKCRLAGKRHGSCRVKTKGRKCTGRVYVTLVPSFGLDGYSAVECARRTFR